MILTSAVGASEQTVKDIVVENQPIKLLYVRLIVTYLSNVSNLTHSERHCTKKMRNITFFDIKALFQRLKISF